MNERAYTLIEVLVALALLSVAVVPLLTSYVVTWRSSLDAQRRSRAVMLARWKMGQLRALEGFSGVQDEDRSECQLKEPHDEVNDKFDCSVRVDGGPWEFNDTRFVTVIVQYDDPFGGESSVELSSTFSCHDPSECP